MGFLKAGTSEYDQMYGGASRPLTVVLSLFITLKPVTHLLYT